MKQNIFSLAGKVAVVTGGNQGIGKVVAGYLADAGADIVIFDLADAADVAAEIAKEYDVKTSSFVCDVTNPANVEEVIQQAGKEMGTLDFLFNNVGICLRGASICSLPRC